MKIYGASDYAVTDDGGDYTVHLVVGIDPSERMWVLDSVAQADFARQVDAAAAGYDGRAGSLSVGLRNRVRSKRA